MDMALLTKPAGPLPVWGWLAVGGGGYLVWRHFSGQSNPSSSTSAATPAPDATGPTDASGVGIPSTGTATTSGLPQVNDPGTIGDWASNALNALISAGVNPTAASNAVNAYINGQPLDLNMQALINRVLQIMGSPPGGPITILPAPIPGTVDRGGAAGNAGKYLAPGPVTGLRQVGVGTHTHTVITWTPVKGATSYTYAVEGKSHNTTTHTATLTGLSKGNHVLVHVSARNARGSGATSTIGVRVT